MEKRFQRNLINHRSAFSSSSFRHRDVIKALSIPLPELLLLLYLIPSVHGYFSSLVGTVLNWKGFCQDPWQELVCRNPAHRSDAEKMGPLGKEAEKGGWSLGFGKNVGPSRFPWHVNCPHRLQLTLVRVRNDNCSLALTLVLLGRGSGSKPAPKLPNP